MFNDKKGPIEHFSWGKFIILGNEHSKNEYSKKGKGKDILLIGTQVYKWKERKGHVLKFKMVSRIFDFDVDVLIIGNGVNECLKCSKDVCSKITKSGIKELIVTDTLNACRKYNELFQQGKKVALFAHGTC